MIASFFSNLFSGIWTVVVLAAIGAGLGIGSVMVGRLWGYTAAAVLGALVLVGAYGTAAFDGIRTKQKDAEIASLKVEKARLEQSLMVERVAKAKQEEIEANHERQLQFDKDQMDKLDALIKKHADDKSACVFDDELKEIFR